MDCPLPRTPSHLRHSAEKNEESIKKMIATINRDKEKMFETIETLDQHKRESVEKTWKKVDRYALPHTFPTHSSHADQSAPIQ